MCGELRNQRALFTISVSLHFFLFYFCYSHSLYLGSVFGHLCRRLWISLQFGANLGFASCVDRKKCNKEYTLCQFQRFFFISHLLYHSAVPSCLNACSLLIILRQLCPVTVVLPSLHSGVSMHSMHKLLQIR